MHYCNNALGVGYHFLFLKFKIWANSRTLKTFYISDIPAKSILMFFCEEFRPSLTPSIIYQNL